MNQIKVVGARIHNLKNINVNIPKSQIIAITGVSGSGKSSLAFDILFEEGMRRYLQSIGLPPKVEKEKPFDLLSGLSPTVAVEQRTARIVSPRSTVGTKTTIYTLLRHLFALESIKTCQICQIPVDIDLSCPTCGMKAINLEIKHFSYNEPSGMCLECKGRGYIAEFREEKLIPDPTKNLLEICASGSAAFGDMKNFTIGLADVMEFDINTPYNRLPQKIQDIFLYGTDKKMQFKWKSRRFEGLIETKFEGIIPHLERAMAKTTSAYRRNKIEKNFMTKVTCPSCHGYKVNEQARTALINEKHIGELGTMTIAELIKFLKDLDSHVKTSHGKALKNEIIKRLEKSKLVGLSYLSLNRSMTTLSGGELQRLSLMSHLDAGLDSLIFILDEPSMGMHELEKNSLMTILSEIKELGNSVIIVEHDRNIISKADQIIDLGPGAGINGGEIIFQGSLEEIKKNKKSYTGKFMSGELQLPRKKPTEKRKILKSAGFLVLKDVTTNNLKNIEIKIPLGIMVGVAGVSGSGKSSLISETLVPLLQEHFNKKNGEEEGYIQIDEIKGKLSGWEEVSDCIVVSQSPIGRTKTSNPVSYIGIWDDIRKLFAKQRVARTRKYSPGHFSFNSDKGRCPHCKGGGFIDLQISFFTKIDLPCEECDGTGYLLEILEVKYKERNIHEILNLTVSESLEIFKNEEKIINHLNILDDIGMGYITLGQPATTLSGGEAQRIKLAKELGRARKKKTLYVLDEPTTGLHYNDILKTITLLDKLVNQGNTVLIIEHDVDVLSYVDYLIELGPQGGPEGGEVIATGSPEDIKKIKQSKVATFLVH
ncbi:MAG: excinuclease ABC subunit UvrA [Candidatus Heimdallarchaeota archaeon]|nr:MAG: excinuclease ABC subunit UvrA [Candidatus Heimdallarchaeota archaeon]